MKSPEDLSQPYSGLQEQSFVLGEFGPVLDVIWNAVDPVQAKWPEQYHDVGVMVTPQGDIYISNRISSELQGLSALHETLCMVHHVAGCTDVERMVVESIPDEEQRERFVDFRNRMFTVLVADNPDNESFKQTRDFLQSIGSE